MRLKSYFITITGIVQSVGFRPFIYKLFNDCSGWVRNDSNGVSIYLETNLSGNTINELITTNKPPNARIGTIKIQSFDIKKRAFKHFFIKETAQSAGGVSIPPDLGICDECAREILDKRNRRYMHPFINCTNCGPRFSIIESTPYDRSKTTMKNFNMCKECKKEYENPNDRRYHAQPIACNNCGPEYFLLKNKQVIEKDKKAIEQASDILKNGGVILLKGIGGYHLICNAFNENSVNKIKKIKNRYKKPFAVIARDMEIIEKYCFVNDKEKEMLAEQIKPIVLLKIKNSGILRQIRSESPYLGVILPYAPIHHLLFYFSNLEFIVATSANFTEKPLIYKDIDAVNFEDVDFVLTNNRKIVRPIEDSIIKVVENEQVIYRYARGFAPGVFLKKTKPNILALGGDLKNNIALSFDNRVILSQYTSDLSEYDNYKRFEEKIEDFMQFFNFKPDIVVCDKHPDYFSTNYALDNFKNVKQIQHHKAHFASVLHEHNLNNDAIGVVMDGTGFGDYKAVWGGEFFVKSGKKIERVGHIKYMPFAFSDRAIKEPYRLAILWLYDILKNKANSHPLFEKHKNIAGIINNIKTFKTSSAGRLFDVASALLGIKEISTYEAESAISLMNSAFNQTTDERFEYNLNDFNIDFKPAIEALSKLYANKNKNLYAAMFHNTFINATINNTINISGKTKIKTVCLSGGVFQNEIVLSGIARGLKKQGLNVYFNSQIPIGDGGIAFGQIWFA